LQEWDLYWRPETGIYLLNDDKKETWDSKEGGMGGLVKRVGGLEGGSRHSNRTRS